VTTFRISAGATQEIKDALPTDVPEVKTAEVTPSSLATWVASVRDKYCPPTSYSTESRCSLCVIVIHSDSHLISQFVQLPSAFRVVYSFPSTVVAIPDVQVLKNEQSDQPCFLRWFEESYCKQAPSALLVFEPFPQREAASSDRIFTERTVESVVPTADKSGPGLCAVPSGEGAVKDAAEGTVKAESAVEAAAGVVEATEGAVEAAKGAPSSESIERSPKDTTPSANGAAPLAEGESAVSAERAATTVPQTKSTEENASPNIAPQSDVHDNFMHCGCRDGRHAKLSLAEVVQRLLRSNSAAKCPMLVLKLPKGAVYDQMLPEITRNTDISLTHDFVAFVCHPLQSLVPRFGGVSAAGRRQFQFLVSNKTGKEHLYQRLQQLLSQKLRNMPMCAKELGAFLDNLVLRERVVDDELIYNHLRQFWYGVMVKRPEYLRNQEDPAAYHKWRTTERLGEIQRMLPLGFQPSNILDVGCSEGSITAALGRGFRLAPSAIFGCDVRDLPGMEQGFTFAVYDGTVLPYPDNSIHLAVALMSLHHVDNITTTLLEIKRALRPGGYFAIREHDMDDQDLAPLIDVFHGMYARVWSDPAEMPEFCSHYKATYRSRLEWTSTLRECGFEQTATSPDRQPLKTSTGRWIKNPFRFYWGCWQKPSK